MGKAKPVIQVENLCVEFDLPEGILRVVEGVNFGIHAGEILALVGESGSGKSVLALSIMGLLPSRARIVSGKIFFRDPDQPHQKIDLTALRPAGKTIRSLRGNRLSIIFQEPMSSLSPLHTIGDQISECLRVQGGRGRREIRELVTEMFHRIGFPNPEKAHSAYPFELSGGLCQRAMIAMALIRRPALLIADEPTTALDVTIQAQILRLIKELQAELGMAVLMITHDLGVVANLAEEMVVLYGGRVMESGAAEELFKTPSHPYLKGLFRAVPRSRMSTGERLVPLREIPMDLEDRGLITPGKIEISPKDGVERPLLSVRNLSKYFVARKKGWGTPVVRVAAVREVDFSVAAGECLGIVGESGSGKSTVCKMIMGALRPDSGKIFFQNGEETVDLAALSPRERFPFRRRIQYVFQDPYHSLNPRITVREILTEPMTIHRLGEPEQRVEWARHLLHIVGLETRHLTRYPHSFSGGQRQRIAIARALGMHPELLICDEPVSALDVSVQAQVLNLLKDLRERLGLTLILVSHNLAVVHYLAERVAVMCAGRLVEIAPRDELFNNPRHPYTQTLLAAVPEPEWGGEPDFLEKAAEGTAVPSQWDPPFRLLEGRESIMEKRGKEHFVRVQV